MKTEREYLCMNFFNQDVQIIIDRKGQEYVFSYWTVFNYTADSKVV